MPNTTLSTELIRNALNEVRKATDRLYKDAKEDDILTPRLRACLNSINTESWRVEETVDQIERDLNTEGESCTL